MLLKAFPHNDNTYNNYDIKLLTYCHENGRIFQINKSTHSHTQHRGNPMKKHCQIQLIGINVICLKLIKVTHIPYSSMCILSTFIKSLHASDIGNNIDNCNVKRGITRVPDKLFRDPHFRHIIFTYRITT